MKKVLESLVGKTNVIIGAVLTVCLGGLFFALIALFQQNEMRNFAVKATTITSYLSEQVDTGTRLRRGEMIEDVIVDAINRDDMNIDAVRITHLEGEEVLSRIASTAPEGVLAMAPAPDFASVSSVFYTERHVGVRVLVSIGAGAQQVTVGELLVFWDLAPVKAAVAYARNLLASAFGVTLLVVVIASTAALKRFVARPLKRMLSAMSGIAAEEVVEMPAADTTEMKEVVVSLRRFQSANEDRKRLQSEQEAERETAQQAREQHESAEKERLREREARQTLARQEAEAEAVRARGLQEDLKAALDLAKQGQFSSQIALKGEANEDRIRGLVNDMMQTVDNGVSATAQVVNALAKGDLTNRMTGVFSGAFDSLQRDANSMSEGLERAIAEVAECSIDVHHNASEISATWQELASRTEMSAASLADTASVVEQFAVTAQSAAENASSATAHVDNIRSQAESTTGVVRKTVAAMEAISKASDQIAQSTNIIDEISFQTNLLALNAGVEAARAGDAGRGFSVVASEVRALAQRCSEAAHEINGMIKASAKHVAEGVALVGDVNDALGHMSNSIQEITSLTREISTGAGEQSAGAQEISRSLQGIDKSTQQTAAMNEEVVAVASSLSSTADRMVQLVQSFNFDSETPATESRVAAAG